MSQTLQKTDMGSLKHLMLFAKPKQISLKKVLFSRLLMLGWNTAKGVGCRGDKNLQHNRKLE